MSVVTDEDVEEDTDDAKAEANDDAEDADGAKAESDDDTEKDTDEAKEGDEDVEDDEEANAEGEEDVEGDTSEAKGEANDDVREDADEGKAEVDEDVEEDAEDTMADCDADVEEDTGKADEGKAGMLKCEVKEVDDRAEEGVERADDENPEGAEDIIEYDCNAGAEYDDKVEEDVDCAVKNGRDEEENADDTDTEVEEGVDEDDDERKAEYEGIVVDKNKLGLSEDDCNRDEVETVYVSVGDVAGKNGEEDDELVGLVRFELFVMVVATGSRW